MIIKPKVNITINFYTVLAGLADVVTTFKLSRLLWRVFFLLIIDPAVSGNN